MRSIGSFGHLSVLCLACLTAAPFAQQVLRQTPPALVTHVPHAGDEDVLIPATGFSLAGTLTKPSGTPPHAVVVLVGGPTATTRDEITGGVPVFGRLAGVIADAGIAALRYDRRASGQSGGRAEKATLTTYADDLLLAIKWLRSRKDIDDDLVAVAAYGEGAPTALLAATRDKKIRAIALLAAPGRTGRDVVLEQQRLELATLNLSPADTASRIDLQRRIIDALTIEAGWDGVPADLRKDTDTPFFKSWLLFDPAVPMKKAGQPLLILQGSSDRQVPTDHAARLEALSRGRTKLPASATTVVVVPQVNHQFVVAPAAIAIDNPSLASQELAPDVVSALTAWLRERLARKPAR